MYAALRAGPSPGRTATVGGPSSTVTASSKVTLRAMRLPIPYVPVPFGDVTDRTRGAAVSRAILEEPDSERGEPGGGSVVSARLPSRSRTSPDRAAVLP